MDSNVAFAKEHGYVTTILGRKRVINEIKSANFNIRSFGERAAMNMPLQGSSADIIKVAMIRIYDRLKREGLRSKLIMQVHDELVIDALISEKEKGRGNFEIRNGACRRTARPVGRGSARREKLV